MKEECKMPCMKTIAWSIVFKVRANALVFIFLHLVLNKLLNVELNLAPNSISFIHYLILSIFLIRDHP